MGEGRDAYFPIFMFNLLIKTTGMISRMRSVERFNDNCRLL